MEQRFSPRKIRHFRFIDLLEDAILFSNRLFWEFVQLFILFFGTTEERGETDSEEAMLEAASRDYDYDYDYDHEYDDSSRDANTRARRRLSRLLRFVIQEEPREETSVIVESHGCSAIGGSKTSTSSSSSSSEVRCTVVPNVMRPNTSLKIPFWSLYFPQPDTVDPARQPSMQGLVA